MQDTNAGLGDPDRPEPAAVYQLLDSRIGDPKPFGRFGLAIRAPGQNSYFLHARTFANSHGLAGCEKSGVYGEKPGP